VEGAIGDALSLNLANGQNVVRCLLGINPRKIGTKIDNIVSPMKTNN
jgi:small ligand-binding sensory domain FIST